MSVSRQIRDRNARAAWARKEEEREKKRKELEGQEHRSPRAELVRRIFAALRDRP